MSLRLVVVQHLLEVSERSNTGRHVPGAWPDTELRRYGVKGEPFDARGLEGAWLLWPGEAAPPPGRPRALVALDASWSQARRMVQRVPALRALPRLSVPAPGERRSLRAAPPGGLSTLEALAEAVALLEGEVKAAPLREAHDALVQAQLRARGYVGKQR